MAYLDDLEVIGTEGHGEGSAHSEDGADAEDQHHQVRAQKRDEKVSGGTAAYKQQVVEFLGPIPLGRRVDGSRRHPGKH